LGKIFIIFNSIFLLEMVFKIIAKGFILHKKSYIRSGWNCLDFIINIYSILEIIYPTENYALRVSRLLRILKAFNIIRGIKRLFISILMSLPILGNVLLFLGFVFVVFGTLGTQLFSGSLYNRCRLDSELVNRNGTIFHTSPPYFERLCTTGNGYYSCPEGYSCVNFYNLSKFFNNSDDYKYSFDDERLQNNTYLSYGISNYDNIFISIINVLTIMTYQDWSLQYNIYIDCNSPVVVQLFFFVIVTIGGFFIMRLILAAQNEAFVKFRLDEKRDKLSFILKLEKMYPKIFEKISKEEMLNKLEYMDPSVLYKNIKEMNLLKLMDDELPVAHQIKVFQREMNISEVKSSRDGASPLSSVSSAQSSSNMSESQVDSSDVQPSNTISEGNRPKEEENEINLNYINQAAENHHKMKKIKTESFHNNITTNITIIKDYTFEHSCPDLSERIKTLQEKGEEIDAFLFK
jgi:hypothetical protein